MRMQTRLAALWLIAPCLGACNQAPPPTPMEQAAAPAPASPAPAPTEADAMRTLTASDAATRAAREQTLRVQQHLRERQRQEQQARTAVQRGTGDERCIAGQKMRRVANGWVQAGPC